MYSDKTIVYGKHVLYSDKAKYVQARLVSWCEHATRGSSASNARVFVTGICLRWSAFDSEKLRQLIYFQHLGLLSV